MDGAAGIGYGGGWNEKVLPWVSLNLTGSQRCGRAPVSFRFTVVVIGCCSMRRPGYETVKVLEALSIDFVASDASSTTLWLGRV